MTNTNHKYLTRTSYEQKIQQRRSKQEQEVQTLLSSNSAQQALQRNDQYINDYFNTYGRLY